jgi:hypothetical protein
MHPAALPLRVILNGSALAPIVIYPCPVDSKQSPFYSYQTLWFRPARADWLIQKKESGIIVKAVSSETATSTALYSD